VDDDAGSRSMYGAFLSAAGFRVDYAADGREGLCKALSISPDLILLDLHMPRIDGWEVMRWLKDKERRTSRIPIIALTADGRTERLKLARNAGCECVLMKPCEQDELLGAIMRLLSPGSVPL
jgi:DNA-binding response OmpR family regulator